MVLVVWRWSLFRSGGGSGDDSLCNGGSCKRCRISIFKVVVVVVFVEVVAVAVVVMVAAMVV